MRARGILAGTLALVCLVGSAVAVAGTIDDEAAERARATQLIADTFGSECSAGCTAGVRAKDRAARIADAS
jgi:hypothetical protein